MIAVTFILVVLVFTGIIFIALPKIRERDEMKRKERLFDESDNYL